MTHRSICLPLFLARWQNDRYVPALRPAWNSFDPANTGHHTAGKHLHDGAPGFSGTFSLDPSHLDRCLESNSGLGSFRKHVAADQQHAASVSVSFLIVG